MGSIFYKFLLKNLCFVDLTLAEPILLIICLRFDSKGGIYENASVINRRSESEKAFFLQQTFALDQLRLTLYIQG